MTRPAWLLAPLLLLGACAPDWNDRNQRAAAGGLVGAAAGGLIGSVTGSAGRGALIGGALGGLAGAVSPAAEPERIPDTPRPAQPIDPRYGGWYDQYGQWHSGPPPEGYQPNYR